MNPRHAVPRLAAILMLVAAHCELLAQATQADYEAKLKEAREHAAQESWSRARDAYAAALPLAPDAEATRWTNHWLVDATWRSEDVPKEWTAKEQWIERNKKSIETLIAEYADAASRDDYWIAVMESRLGFERKANNDRESVEIQLTIADHLATRRADSTAISRYLDFLVANISEPVERTYDSDPRSRWLGHLDRGAEIARNPEERARFLVGAARQAVLIESIPISECADRWNRAIVESRGTIVASLSEALRFVFLAGTGFEPRIAEVQPADFPKLIAEAKRLFAQLEAMHLRYDEQATPLSTEVGAAAISLGQLEKLWSAQYLTLDAPQEIMPGEALKVAFGAAGYSEVAITLVKQEPKTWAREIAQRSPEATAGSFGGMISRDDANAIRAGALSVVHTETVRLPDVDKLGWHAGEFQISAAMEPGFYTLLADATGPSGAGTWRQNVVATSAAATSISVEGNDATIYFHTKADGGPLAEMEVRGVVITGKESRAFDGVTDADGAMKMSGSSQIALRLFALVGHQPVDFIVRRRTDRTTLIADVILDRPVYRPGETVYWKMVLRDRTEGRFKVSRKRVWVSVKDSRSETILDRAPISSNEFGTAHGSFVIPESTLPGQCAIEFYPAKDAEDLDSLIEEAFTVDNFVPPAITSTIELASPADSLQPGREIRVRVSSRYFSGGSVVGAPVKLAFDADLGWDYRHTREARDHAINEWAESLHKNARTAETDVNGIVEFPLSLPSSLPNNTNLNAHAIVAPVGAQADNTSVRWSVNETGFHVDPLKWRVARPVRPGKSVEFECVVKDGRDMPIAFSGVASLIELSWGEAWLSPEGKMVSGEALAEERKKLGLMVDEDRIWGWKKLHSGYARSVVAESPVESANDGRVHATFKVPHAGLFQLELSQFGSAIPSEPSWDFNIPLSVVAADESTAALPIKPGCYLLGAPEYSPGKPLSLLSIIPDGFGPGVLVVSGEDNYRTHKLELPNRVTWIEIKDPPGFAGGGTATLASLKDSLMPAATHNFSVSDPSSRLSVTVDPRESVSLPGTETEVFLRILDASGQPWRTEVLLGVADESVRQLVLDPEELPVDPRFSNYRHTPFVNVEKSASRSGRRWETSLRDPRPGAILSPDGMPRLDFPVPVMLESAMMSASPGMSIAGTRLRTEAIEILGPGMADLFDLAQLDKMPPPIITRRFFASTAAWMPEIVTDANGEARVTFKYPDNLTEWHFDAYAVGADGNTFGRTSVLTRTSLPLQARIQAPRFLIEGDSSDVGVLLLNRTDDPLTAEVSLAVEGAAAIDRSKRAPKKGVAVPKQGEARVTWSVEADEVGYAKVTTTSRAGDLGDAMEIPLPVLPDGFWQETAASGRLGAGSNEQVLKLLLPDPLDPEKVNVKLKLSPGHVPALLDALPYLVDYPYGCVEQTMSRFLPALVVRHTLVELGLEEEDVESRIVANESAADRARREKTAGLLKIDEVAEKSLAKLAEAQTYSGGFGWWPGQSAIDPWMTAYVVWGLALARESDFEVPDEMEENARDALCGWIARTENTTDVLAWALFATSQSELEDEQSNSVAKVFTRVMAERSRLGPSGRACLALAAKRWGSNKDQATLVRNLENGAEHSHAAGLGETVHWGSSSGYWRGTDGAVECTALTLLALEAHDGKHPLIEPAANWLALNRRSARWTNTRDTALAVLALSKVVANGPSLDSNASIEIAANKSPPSRLAITREALLADELGVMLPAESLKPGENSVRIRLHSGEGPVYALALASSWAQNEGAEPSGHLIEAARRFDRRVPVPMVSGTMRFNSESIASGGMVMAGEEVIAVITLTVPNELEYLAVEVPKPAGCEPLNPLSGWDAHIRNLDSPPDDTGNAHPETPIYREEHDSQSVFFLDHIYTGKWEIRFGMRSTTSGDYRAAPVKVGAMYAPEVRANTDARRLKIEPVAN